MKAIVSLSGGMDSATVLAEALEQGREVRVVGFTYGSKHNRWENAAATLLAHHYGVPFHLIDLTAVMRGFRSHLLLSGPDVPEGHYEEETMRQTVVPARNTIFSAILAGIAVSEDAHEIWLGVHAGDHYIYPDCRPEFIASLQETLRLGTGDKELEIKTPFLHVAKPQILQRGLSLSRPVPYHLTRTCYTSNLIACGKCGSCQERLVAWQEIGQRDPLSYHSREILPKKGVAS